ncbi:hypothetical protein CEUSTIGMA_g9468.t1 [Chlamydomonas eustigma]|uniref:SLC41A/MgtE integral membrane domain-containing protein n=1 Tax=Chlamydomonas eustigma TaxID=1157962 RepID=A0A250XGX6_9CHLO|nr:hypothetical protein CEUSTIGMA_g9468.t1 [Chlamydomonas eustigma]|eukprot:GAX82040.1 hypothetical protein CEUSTIGMA_g9468.t1 [Chlamydomonas eustigma]
MLQLSKFNDSTILAQKVSSKSSWMHLGFPFGHNSDLKHRPHPFASALDKDLSSSTPSTSRLPINFYSTTVTILSDKPVITSDLQSRKALCDSGLPDVDECLIAEPPPATSPIAEAWSRGRWLMGLLIFQSTSSFVLDRYQDLLRDHLVVTLFLTMLVGAGGNAGNQSAIKVIRALATGSVRPSWQSIKNTMAEQAAVGLLLGGGLSVGGFIRVYLTNGDLRNSFSISLSLFLIVMTSVILGTGLPFALAKTGVDPANAGTTIQVVMDILGVVITCVTCDIILNQLQSAL